jgi:hypothetical protein
MSDNLSELHKAESGLSMDERCRRYNVLIGALSYYVDSRTWAKVLNTTYGYIKGEGDREGTA